MTPKQQKDIECVKFFIPNCIKNITITEEDELKFLEWSEQGKHKDEIGRYIPNGFRALVEGKKWRGIHIFEMWEPGILEGVVGYFSLLGGERSDKPLPRIVVDFVKKEIFKGADSELIERIYQNILLMKRPWWKKLIAKFN